MNEKKEEKRVGGILEGLVEGLTGAIADAIFTYDFTSIMGRSPTPIVGVLSPLLDVFSPIVERLFDKLSPLLKALEPLSEAVGPLVKLVGFISDPLFKNFSEEYNPTRLYTFRVFIGSMETIVLWLGYEICKGRLRFLIESRTTRNIVSYLIVYPIAKWVTTGVVTPTRDVISIIQQLEGKIAVGPCQCRGNIQKYSPTCKCDHPLRTDMAIRTGTEPFKEAFPKDREYIEKDEAIRIVDECSKKGMFNQVFVHCMYGGAINEWAICNCCTDGCVPYILNRTLGQEVFPLIRGDEFSVTDKEMCDRSKCSDECIEVCPFDARNIVNNVVKVGDCFGCGLCELKCPNDAIKLVKKEKTVPFRGKYVWEKNL